jgi:hypothetical protein
MQLSNVTSTFKRFFLFILMFTSLLLGGCEQSQYARKTKIVDRSINHAIRRIIDNFDLYLTGVGKGGHPELNTIDLCFGHYGVLSKDELRLMVVTATEILLEEINSNEEVKFFLIRYPFTNRDVRISIVVRAEDGSSLFHPHHCVGGAYRGNVYFRTNDPDREYCYLEESKEPYEEAKAIAFSKSLPKSSVRLLQESWDEFFSTAEPNQLIYLVCQSPDMIVTRDALLDYDKERRKRINVLAIAPRDLVDEDTCGHILHLMSPCNPIPYTDFKEKRKCSKVIRDVKNHPPAKLSGHAVQSPSYKKDIEDWIRLWDRTNRE